MFFTAWKLRFDNSLQNPKVFVLVDRIDLDNQIYDSFINAGGKNVIRVTSQRDLAKKITNDERGIFISTILIVHFIMGNHIEKLKTREETFHLLHGLNHELEKRAKELESSQEMLQRKVQELERYNEIAKERELKMLSLIKKEENIEENLRKKK